MEQILTEWGLRPDAIKEILDNAIDMDQLKELSDEQIKQLAPKLGDQWKLTAGIKKLFKSDATEEVRKPKNDPDPTAIVKRKSKGSKADASSSKNSQREKSNSQPAKKIKLENSNDDDSKSQPAKKKRNKYLPAKLKLVKSLLSDQEMLSELKEKTGDAFKDCTKAFFKKNAKSIGKYCIVNQAKGGQQCPFCMKFVSPQIYKSKVNVCGYTWNMTNFRRHLNQKHADEAHQALDERINDTNPPDYDISSTKNKNLGSNDVKLPVPSSSAEVPLNQHVSGSENDEVSGDKSVCDENLELSPDAGCTSGGSLNQHVSGPENDQVSGDESVCDENLELGPDAGCTSGGSLNQHVSGPENDQVSGDESVCDENLELGPDAGCTSGGSLNQHVSGPENDQVSGDESVCDENLELGPDAGCTSGGSLNQHVSGPENDQVSGDESVCDVKLSPDTGCSSDDVPADDDTSGGDTSDGDTSDGDTSDGNTYDGDTSDIAQLNAHGVQNLLPPHNESSDESEADDVPAVGGSPTVVNDWQKSGVRFSWVKFTKRSKYLPSFIFPTDGLAQHITRCGELSDLKFIVDSECVNPPEYLKPKAYLRALSIFNLMTGSSFQ